MLFFLVNIVIIAIILFIINVNRCCVCVPSGVVLWRLVQVPGQAVAVASADSAAAVLASPAALVVRLRPVGGK